MPPIRCALYLQAWLTKLSRRAFDDPEITSGAEGGNLSPVLLQAITEFFHQEGFIQVGTQGQRLSIPYSLLCHSRGVNSEVVAKS